MKRTDGHPVRVLVVDDEPSLAELMANVLRSEGWEIQTAGDGASAVRAAREPLIHTVRGVGYVLKPRMADTC